MPPAIVDLRSPAAPSSTLEPNPSPTGNPGKGEISAPRSSYFGSRSSIPASSRPDPGSVPGFVDRTNLGQRNPGSGGLKNSSFDGSFASPAPPVTSSPFHPVSASGKPSTATGLSKPRLVKVRKHVASSRVRQAVNVDADDGSGFNPFHSRPVDVTSDTSERNQGSGVQGLNQKLHGRKPFESETGFKVSEDSNSGNFKSEKPESAGFVMSNVGDFVFGSSAKKGSNCRRSTRKKVFMAENIESKRSVKNVGSADVAEGTFSFGNVPSGSSDTGTFVLSCGMKKNSISEEGPLEGLSDQSKGNFASMKSETGGFVFGASSALNLGTEDNGFGNKRDRILHSGASVFQIDLKRSSNPCQNSPENSNGLNCGSFEFGKSESVKNVGSANLVERTFSFCSVQSGTPDAGTFVFSSGMKKNPIPEQGPLEGLSGQNKGNVASAKSESAGFGFGASSVPNQGIEDIAFGNKLDCGDHSGSFIFQSDLKQSSNLHQNSPENSNGLNHGSFEFGKSESATFVSSFVDGNSGSTDRDTFIIESVQSKVEDSCGNENPRSDSCGSEIEDTSYPFKIDATDNHEAPGSFRGCTINEIHEDMKKLNIRSEKGNSLGSHTHCEFTFQAGKQDTNSRVEDVQPSKRDDRSRLRGVASTPFDPSSSCHVTHSVGTGFTFASRFEELKPSHMEFTTPIHVTPVLSKENLFTGSHQNKASNVKKGECRTTRKKRRDKSRQSVHLHQNSCQTPGGCSPMDYSPYQENLVVDQSSRETSVTSDESYHIFSSFESIGTKKSIPVDERKEHIVSATHHSGASKDDVTLGEPEQSSSGDYSERVFFAKPSCIGEQIPEHGRESFVFESGNKDLTSTSSATGIEAETDPCYPKIEPQTSERENCVTLNSKLNGFSGSSFTFGALSFAQGQLSVSKRRHRRKSKMKASKNINNLTPNANVPLYSPSEDSFSVATAVEQTARDLKGTPAVPQSGGDVRAETHTKLEDRKDHIPTIAAALAEQQACNKWRLRGNQAYSNGDMPKAEEFYTRGLNSISIEEVSRNSNSALMLCYSNRAAARMSLGRMREALSDCMMAVAIDPSFLRAHVRAANCHLALGEIEDALQYFNDCLQSNTDGSLNQKILMEASDGLLKTQQVADYMVQSKELMLKRSSIEAAKALQIISEALLVCPYSEQLMERKAEALLMLRSYEEVILFCEQTIEIAERNSSLNRVNKDNFEDTQTCSIRLWRWRLMSKSYFCLGRFEEALELLKKHEQVKSILDKNGNGSSESLASLFGTIRELLRLKAAGNEAFQAGKHLDAVEHYSAALACNTESFPFTAICFCNRAAAYQAIGQIADAIADCSVAIALDASYPKAISRRATLHEMIRDYGQAANDLRRLISLLEKQLKDKGNQAGTLGRITANGDLNRAHVRLCSVEEEAKKETPLDLYMILGIEHSSSAADVKKAYRKAALRHHPDKAGQFLARSENIDDGLRREVVDEVHKDADRLFKMIGEAYTVLSDPTKCLQYDAEEEMRTTLRKGNGVRHTPKSQDNYGSTFDKSSSRRQWRAYGSSHQRCSETSRSKTHDRWDR